MVTRKKGGEIKCAIANVVVAAALVAALTVVVVSLILDVVAFVQPA